MAHTVLRILPCVPEPQGRQALTLAAEQQHAEALFVARGLIHGPYPLYWTVSGYPEVSFSGRGPQAAERLVHSSTKAADGLVSSGTENFRKFYYLLFDKHSHGDRI